jgi:prepilin-type N-terminal cleavage/methylation domain-containing protein
MQETKQPSFPERSGSAGYTLVELAICLCIIGILS